MILLAGLAAADVCADAAARIGHRVCVTTVADARTWKGLTIGSRTHWTRYLVPSRPDARLPTLIVDAHAYELHLELLREGFAPLFPGLDQAGYARLVLNPARREFYGGNLVEHGGSFGFTVEEVGSGPITAADVEAVRKALASAFTLAPLTFEPSDAQAARGLGLAAPVGRYEVYSDAEAFGVVRFAKADALPEDLSPRDVLVLDAAPWDLATPVAAAVTARPTGELSHLSVRSNARGTPACYDVDALTVFKPWEGKLVQVSCGADALTVRAAEPTEAAAWEARRRPAPVRVPSVEAATAFVGLRELPTGTAEERTSAVRRYGAKGANYAALVQRVPAEWVYDGFLVPLQAYVDATRSMAPRIFGLLADPAGRKAGLVGLRAEIEALQAPLVPALSERVAALFGETTMVRFRSSSNCATLALSISDEAVRKLSSSTATETCQGLCVCVCVCARAQIGRAHV